jgi:hypothetical protein
VDWRKDLEPESERFRDFLAGLLDEGTKPIQDGMDLMPNGLMAMLPCNKVQAHAKRWNDMPYKNMLDALVEKKHGKLMRLDDAVKTNVPPGTIDDDLFLEISVPMN